MIKRKTSIGWSDPRTEIGQLLWEERFGPAEIDILKRTMGAYTASGQLQQSPAPAEGGLLKRDWWKRYDAAPPYFDETILSFDCTFKDTKSADFVVGQAWGRLGADFYLIDQIRRRMDFPATLTALREMSTKHRMATAKLVEEKANGAAVISVLKHEIPGLIAVNPEGGKVARVQAISPLVEAGNVYLPNEPWVDEFINECASFPNATHDDMVDAASQSLFRLKMSAAAQFFGEFRPHGRRSQDGTNNANHVVDVVKRGDDGKDYIENPSKLESWWFRWISLYWSPLISLAHWYCEDGDGRVRVYREFSGERLTAEELGIEVARQSRDEVEQGRTLTAWIEPEYFEGTIGQRTIAQAIGAGIERELHEPVFLYGHNTDERSNPDAPQRLEAFQRRMTNSKSRIMIQGALNDEPAANWEHARSLIRWWPLTKQDPLEFDMQFAMALRNGEDGENRYAAYMRACMEPKREVLPRLLISEKCQALIASLTTLMRDERNPAVPIVEQQQAARSFLNGMIAHRATAAREPLQEFTAHRLNALIAKNPQANEQSKFMVEQKARGDYQKSRAPRVFTFKSASRKGFRVA